VSRGTVQELRKIVGKEIVLVIAGNKADLEKNRQVCAPSLSAVTPSDLY
jgi:hypothetical protein